MALGRPTAAANSHSVSRFISRFPPVRVDLWRLTACALSVAHQYVVLHAHFPAGLAARLGGRAEPETTSRIHIPAAPCPATPKNSRKLPSRFAINRKSSVASGGSPSANLSVKARSKAGG